MLAQQLPFALLVVVLGTNALLVYWMYRLGRRLPEGSAGAVDNGSNTVECPDCGAENELGYRYCGSCVSELPASRRFQREPTSPFRQTS